MRLLLILSSALAVLSAPCLAQDNAASTPAGGGPAGSGTASTSQTQGFGPIVPNRPGFTNGSATIAPGDALAENGAALSRMPAALGGQEVLDFPETNLRIGVTPNLETDVTLPDYYDVHGGDRGFGDAAIGVKYKFYQSRDGGTKASVAPSLTLPTHTLFSSGQYDPTILLGIQTASGARWSLASNLVLGDPTVSGSRNLTTTLSGSVSYTLTPTLSAYFDAFDVVPRTGPTSPTADSGFAYMVNNNVQLDAELYVGLGAAAPVRVLEGGLSFRI